MFQELLFILQGIDSGLIRVRAGKLTDTVLRRFVIFIGSALTAIGILPLALAGSHANFLWLSAASIVIK